MMVSHVRYARKVGHINTEKGGVLGSPRTDKDCPGLGEFSLKGG